MMRRQSSIHFANAMGLMGVTQHDLQNGGSACDGGILAMDVTKVVDVSDVGEHAS